MPIMEPVGKRKLGGSKHLEKDSVVNPCLDYFWRNGFEVLGYKANKPIRDLPAHGGVVWRQNTGSIKLGGRYVRFGVVGGSDIMGWTPAGKFLAIEAKRPGATLKPEQQAFLDRLRFAGGVGLVVRRLQDLIDQWEQIR